MNILLIKKLNKTYKEQLLITYKMNLGIIVLIILMNIVDSLRPFKNCNGCVFNNNCPKNTKKSIIVNNDIWKEYEDDPNPPIDIEKRNIELEKFISKNKNFSELKYNYRIKKIFSDNLT